MSIKNLFNESDLGKRWKEKYDRLEEWLSHETATCIFCGAKNFVLKKDSEMTEQEKKILKMYLNEFGRPKEIRMIPYRGAHHWCFACENCF